MAVRCFTHKYRKLTASLIIILTLWGISALHNVLSVCGSPGPETVSIVQVSNYPVSDQVIEDMVRDAVEKAGGLPVSPGDWVVIKPNLVETMWTSGSGVITDVRIIRTVVMMAQEAGASRVTIAEGSAAFRGDDPERDNNNEKRHFTRKAFHDSGLDKYRVMIDDVTGAELWDLNIAGGYNNPDPSLVTEVTLIDGLLEKSFYVPNILLECDVLISVPILKNHSLGGITGSLKNRVGCVPNDLYHYSSDLPFYKHRLVHWGSWSEGQTVNRAIVDLERVRPSDFTVMDGLIGITNGPTGTDKPTPYVRSILAGRDAVAVDTIQALMMGYNPNSIQHLVHCRNMGFGQANPAMITVVGKSVAEVRNLFPDGYGGAQRVELVPPSIGGMTPANGSTVSGIVNVALSGVTDNVGVVRAELYVNNELKGISLAQPFEFVWDTSGYPNGAYELRATVYDAARNEASMYQSVFIEDGWNAQITATGGGLGDVFTFGCASGALDGVDASDVPKSFSSPHLSLATLMSSTYYSHDYKSLMDMNDAREWNVHVVTDINPSPTPITISWDSIDWSEIPSTLELRLIDHGTSWGSNQSSYNMRATDSITLPASGTGLVRCLTIQARKADLSSIANAKHLPNGETVYLLNKIVTAGNDNFVNTFYVADPDGTSGIQVLHSEGSVPTIRSGDVVNVFGTLTTRWGERTISSPTVRILSTNSPVPNPWSMPNRSVGGEALGQYAVGITGSMGPNNIGSLIRTWGRVTHVDGSGTLFYIDDGSGRVDGSGVTGLRVRCNGRVSGNGLTVPTVNSYVAVTGISTTNSSTNGPISVIRPRTQDDIVIR